MTTIEMSEQTDQDLKQTMEGVINMMNHKNEANNRICKAAGMLLALAVLLSVNILPVAAAQKVWHADYEGKGKVGIDFDKKVRFNNPKVIVKDTEGNTYKVKITDQETKELEFKILGYAADRKYTYQVSGVRLKGESEFRTIKGQITIPKEDGKARVKKVEYDRLDKEVSFKFDEKVKWKSPKVVITDGKTSYVRRITETDRDEIEVKVRNLKKGVTYRYTISGVKGKGNKNYTTISGSFKAVDCSGYTN